MIMDTTAIYTHKEELANTITHVFGVLLGLIASYYLLGKAYAHDDVHWAVSSVLVYLFGMLSSYGISVIYHGCSNRYRKKKLQKIDHAAIYLHIAGTYTPFTLITLRHAGSWGWMLFSFVWFSALLGILMSFRNLDKHSHLETLCYVIMGSVILIAFKPFMDVLGSTGRMDVLYWIIAGGVFYIVGALFYSFTRIRYMHTVFHLFVVGGSVCHILAVYAAL